MNRSLKYGNKLVGRTEYCDISDLIDRILFGLDECKTTVGQTGYRTL